ncbi:DNA-binding transcription factor yap1 [Elasticomyces elasticus]|nr:DNA-binding transcription factor yap1 [Elasticomyces elasticus]
MDSFEALFTPSVLNNAGNTYFSNNTSAQPQNRSRGSLDNSHGSVPGLSYGSSVSNTESPGSSSGSQNHISSIHTSPEPNFNSSPNKQQDQSLYTLQEDSNNLLTTQSFRSNAYHANSSLKDVNSFDPNFNFTSDTDFSFLTAQNNTSTFDPVLFGDYRETPDNGLNQDFNNFFNDVFPLPDLGSPNHNFDNSLSKVSTLQALGPTHPSAQAMMGGNSTVAPDLMSRVDALENSQDIKPREAPKLMTCNKIWDRLQSMEKFRNGEIDIDNLCSELKAKAKCSEGGAVVEESHVNKILGL